MATTFNRFRRLREIATTRAMVRETHLRLEHLIMPLFVHHGHNIRHEISSMPGQFQFSIDQLIPECKRLEDLGLRAIILFGIPEHKDAHGSGAYADDGIIQQAMRALKAAGSKLLLIGDVCLCEYTSHGHCGLLKGEHVDNDATLPLLARTAVSQARAGADMIAPSDMMDGRIGEIRAALDAEGFAHLPIMSYAAKYASAFYGPFRDAAGSAPAFGDRRSHQMDPPNSDEALREAEADMIEGADILMVKPALAYLDIIQRIKQQTGMPVAAYAVSGEYAMIEAAAAKGWLDRDRVIYESLIAIRRAGADLILTYHAPRVAELMLTGTWPLA
jgi:porphobilinogen synthase